MINIFVNKEKLSDIVDAMEDCEDIVLHKQSKSDRICVTIDKNTADKIKLEADNYLTDSQLKETGQIIRK